MRATPVMPAGRPPRRASLAAPLPVAAVIAALTSACQDGGSAKETFKSGAASVKDAVASAWVQALTVVSPGVELPESDPLLATRKPSGFDYAALEANRNRDLAEQRASGRGLIDAPALTDYLNAVLAGILAKAPEQNVPARIYVKDSNEINAAALPSGAIVVPVGMLRVIDSEDELAFLLGHEASHVLQRHHGSDWYVSAQKHALSAMELGFDVAKAFRHRYASEAENQLDDLMLAGEAALMLSESLLAPAWTRTQEDEADVLGLDLMREAGYNYQAAFTLLAKLGEAEKQLQANAPPPSERVIDYVGERADESGLRRHFDPGKWRRIVEGAAKQAWAWVNRQLGRNHRTHEERKTFLTDYADRYGPARGALKPVPWSDKGHKARDVAGHDARAIRAVFDSYELAARAEQVLEKRDAKRALDLARQASRPTAHTVPYPWVVNYDAQVALRRRDAARQELRRGVASGEPSLILYYRMLEAPIARKDWSEAWSLVEQAQESVGDAPQLLPLRVYLLVHQDKKTEAVLLSGQCRLEYPEIAGPLCIQALEGRDWQPRERIASR